MSHRLQLYFRACVYTWGKSSILHFNSNNLVSVGRLRGEIYGAETGPHNYTSNSLTCISCKSRFLCECRFIDLMASFTRKTDVIDVYHLKQQSSILTLIWSKISKWISKCVSECSVVGAYIVYLLHVQSLGGKVLLWVHRSQKNYLHVQAI